MCWSRCDRSAAPSRVSEPSGRTPLRMRQATSSEVCASSPSFRAAPNTDRFRFLRALMMAERSKVVLFGVECCFPLLGVGVGVATLCCAGEGCGGGGGGGGEGTAGGGGGGGRAFAVSAMTRTDSAGGGGQGGGGEELFTGAPALDPLFEGVAFLMWAADFLA